MTTKPQIFHSIFEASSYMKLQNKSLKDNCHIHLLKLMILGDKRLSDSQTSMSHKLDKY